MNTGSQDLPLGIDSVKLVLDSRKVSIDPLRGLMLGIMGPTVELAFEAKALKSCSIWISNLQCEQLIPNKGIGGQDIPQESGPRTRHEASYRRHRADCW